MERKFKSVEFAEGKTLKFETGKIARQADGSCLLHYGDTIIFGSACASKESDPSTDFSPYALTTPKSFFLPGKHSAVSLNGKGAPLKGKF